MLAYFGRFSETRQQLTQKQPINVSITFTESYFLTKYHLTKIEYSLLNTEGAHFSLQIILPHIRNGLNELQVSLTLFVVVIHSL